MFLANGGKVDAVDEDVVYSEGELAGDADEGILAFEEVGVCEVGMAYFESVDDCLVMAG